MELKGKLKQLRQERGMTQAQLAEALFVSRSTVAKWENGLGLPNPESMKALEELFEITRDEISTSEPETVIVEKNRKLRRVLQAAGTLALIALTVIFAALAYLLYSGSYGFTPDMAAGVYADREYIDTGDYRIYYFTFEGELEGGNHWSALQGFRPVQKHFWGCTVSKEDYTSQVFTKNNYVVGRLYTIQGKNGYYNLISKAGHYKAQEPGMPLIWDIPGELITAASVTIGGTEYELQEGFFFITPEPVKYFRIAFEWYDVEET